MTGDVECEGEIISVETNGIARHYKIKMDKKYMKYVVEKGRITLDGASLTVIDAENDTFSVSLIPHTIKNIILGSKKNGDLVNIETDLFAKYMLQTKKTSSDTMERAISSLSLKFTDVRKTKEGLLMYVNTLMSHYLRIYQDNPDEFFNNAKRIQLELKTYIDLMLYGIIKEESDESE